MPISTRHRRELKDSISATSQPLSEDTCETYGGSELPCASGEPVPCNQLFWVPPPPMLTPRQIVFYRVGNRCARRGLADPK